MRSAVLALLCACVLSAPVSARDNPSDKPIPVRVKEVLLIGESPAVLLVDEPEQRYLLVFVDYYMASAIRLGMNKRVLQRPMTHDLIGTLLHHLHARLTGVTITELKDSIYYALIFLEVNGRQEQLDARPSDALAIAVRSHAPIRVAGHLLKPIDATPQPDEEKAPQQRIARPVSFQQRL